MTLISPLCLALAFCLSAGIAGAQTICLDPGHPSENGSGTRGKRISELHAAWKVGVRLNQLLSEAGYRVTMTRGEENKVVTNKERAEIGNAVQADLVLRLHCDAGTKSGFATYYPGRTGTVGGVTGPSKAVMQRSHQLGQVFHRATIAALNPDLADRGLHTEADTFIGSKQGALTGSIYSKVPVLLVEMAVLQNAHDDAFIASEKGQEKLAKALFAGIRAAVPLHSSPLPPSASKP